MTEQEQQQLDSFRETVSVGDFKNEPYVRRVEKPWGWEIHWTPDNLPYMGKILHVNEGKRLSLQVHDKKQESWYLLSGNGIVVIENQNGEMEEVELEEGKGYTCHLGQKHRLKGGNGGCDILEVSTPEIGNTFRLEDDFNRNTETEEEREKRNKGAV